MTTPPRKFKIWTMKGYGEYCPVAMGFELVGDRWTPLLIRELICGSTRFNEIHRGVPRMSRSLLAGRLRHLERVGLVHRSDGEYHLTTAGEELTPWVMGLGEWAMRWCFGDPTEEHWDGAHLLWRMRQRIDVGRLPERRVVVQFDLPRARHGKRLWLVLEPSGHSVCERDEGFDPDLFVTGEIGEMLRVWAGRSTWDDAMAAGDLRIDGPRDLVRAFPSWFLLSPFAELA